MIRVATHRAILDWHQRPKRRNQNELREQSEDRSAKPNLPGIVGVVKHRVIFEVDERLARNVIRICDEALESPDLHDAKRGAIEQTKREMEQAIKQMKGDAHAG